MSCRSSTRLDKGAFSRSFEPNHSKSRIVATFAKLRTQHMLFVDWSNILRHIMYTFRINYNDDPKTVCSTCIHSTFKIVLLISSSIKLFATPPLGTPSPSNRSAVCKQSHGTGWVNIIYNHMWMSLIIQDFSSMLLLLLLLNSISEKYWRMRSFEREDKLAWTLNICTRPYEINFDIFSLFPTVFLFALIL